MCQSSYLSRHFTELNLYTNVKDYLHRDHWTEIFSEHLSLLGNGKMVPDPDGQIIMEESEWHSGPLGETEEMLINKLSASL